MVNKNGGSITLHFRLNIFYRQICQIILLIAGRRIINWNRHHPETASSL